MNVSGIPNSNVPIPTISNPPATQSVTGAGTDSDGDNDARRVSGSQGASGGAAAFMSAIFQALSSAGVSSTTPGSTAASGNGISTTQDPVQALGSFMHSLFAALQSQGGTATQGSPQTGSVGRDGDGDSDSGATTIASGISGTRHRGSGIAQLESNLQGLIQQVESSAAASSTTDPTASGNTAPTTAASASGDLQQNYEHLLSALGVSGTSSSLGSFLQALSQNLQSIGSTGNVVNTHA